jgi:small subunit ribosomal protein S8e
MAVIHHRAKRKPTGGRYKHARKKRLFEMGNLPAMTKIGERKAKVLRTRGKNFKTRLFKTNSANLFDPKTKTFSKAKIDTVVENTADRHYVRRNIITKGCVIMTEKGKAKVTSRPGQDGMINAILIQG